MIDWSTESLRLVAVLTAGYLIPALGIRMLLPALADSPLQVTNYRGVGLSTGLGLVWVFWILGVLILAGVSFASTLLGGDPVAALLYESLPLVTAAFVFGLIDDAYGSGSARGFRGHLKALARGKLTTGGLKMVGIGIAALGTAIIVSLARSGDDAALLTIATVLVSAAVMALSANLVNLLDLRPGRALKAYSAIAVVAVGIAMVQAVFSGLAASSAALQGVELGFMLLGPVAAVWSLDLGEKGMLGDAGANVMGALAGYVLVIVLPLSALLVAAVVLFALNVSSERYSFSRVIEGNAVLRAVDGIGRKH